MIGAILKKSYYFSTLRLSPTTSGICSSILNILDTTSSKRSSGSHHPVRQNRGGPPSPPNLAASLSSAIPSISRENNHRAQHGIPNLQPLLAGPPPAATS